MNLRKTLVFLPFLLLLVNTFSVFAQVNIKPFMIQQRDLEASREQIEKKNPTYLKALEELKKTADEALKLGPYSVTYKEKAPPGGTKNDYFSVGPYWWPDSSKADGLPYIRKDGQVNPERYTIRDVIFHKSLCKDLYVLGLAHYFTADKRYASHAGRLLKVWFLDKDTRMNPHLNFGQAIPGITSGRGIGLIDTHLLNYLIDGIQILKSKEALDDEIYEGVQNWHKEFLDWMLNSPIGKDEASQHNNHGTYYDVQAVSIALFTNQIEIARDLLNEKSKDRIDMQLAEDGSQPHELARTLSWNYSQMNLAGFFELATLAESADIDLWNYRSKTGKSIKNALTWMLPYAEDKKTWTHKQIKAIDKSSYLKTAYVAATRYPDLDLTALWQTNGRPDNPILLLTNSLF